MTPTFRLRLLPFAFLLLAGTIQTNAQDNLKLEDSTALTIHLTGILNKGEVVKTANNHFYEINEKIVQPVNTDRPGIKVYKDGRKYKMFITGIDKPIAVNKLTGVIESNIDGDFKGWDGTTIFKLKNLQQWQQDAPGNLFTNLFNPAVLIYSTSEGYKMKIEGVKEDPIIVKKIK